MSLHEISDIYSLWITSYGRLGTYSELHSLLSSFCFFCCCFFNSNLFFLSNCQSTLDRKIMQHISGLVFLPHCVFLRDDIISKLFYSFFIRNYILSFNNLRFNNFLLIYEIIASYQNYVVH